MIARDLDGKILLLSGGSRGIGRAIVLAATARGAKVAFCGRTIDGEAQKVVEEAEHRGGRHCALAMQADISKEADVDRFFDATIDRFGRVDVAINNAAISLASLVVSMPTEAWEGVMAVNLTAAFVVTRRAIRAFRSVGRGGRIVLVGSLAQAGAAVDASYAASKGGLVGLTAAVAHQYREEQIAANLVVPGYVPTELSKQMPETIRRSFIDFCPQRRAATPEEIASVVLFLASDRALGITGQTVFATGGLLQVPQA